MSSHRNVRQAVTRLAILSLLLIFALGACNKQEPLKIGFVGGLSGRVADLGLAGRNGAILAVEEYNENRGTQERSIELLISDDRQDPDIARTAVTGLIDQGVTAIIGHMTSAMSVSTVPLANQKQLVMISPTTTTEQLSGRDDYFFRVIDSTKSYATRGASYLRTNQLANKVSVIYDLNNEAFTTSYLSDFRSAFEEQGGLIVKTQPYRSKLNISYLDLVKEAITPETDGILIIASALDAALLCQQIRKIKADIPIITSEWSATEKFINLGGSAVEGVLSHQYFDRESKETRYLKFRKAYISQFGEEPGFASVGGYDATNVAIEALRRQPEGKTLKETILSIATFSGIQQKIIFDRFGDTSRDTHLSVVRDGKFVVLN